MTPITEFEFSARTLDYVKKETEAVLAFCMATAQDRVPELLILLHNQAASQKLTHFGILQWRTSMVNTEEVIKRMGKTEKDVRDGLVGGKAFALAVINYLYEHFVLREINA